MSAWEYDPDGMIDDHTVRDLTDAEMKGISQFEGLTETIPAIPASILKMTEELYAAVGADKYEEFAVAAIRAVGYQSFPCQCDGFSGYTESFNSIPGAGVTEKSRHYRGTKILAESVRQLPIIPLHFQLFIITFVSNIKTPGLVLFFHIQFIFKPGAAEQFSAAFYCAGV